MPLTPGSKVGNYEIINQLGAGGMGVVYRARDIRLNREVAIKVLPSDFANDSDRLQRFEQEARATSALNHPNILTVYDIGTHEGAPYMVAELLEGEELREQIGHGTLPVKRAIDYAQQVASGLTAAHEKGIVHRDLKPENLFVTKDGRVKILDFGLAKVRTAGSGYGSSEIATQKQITEPGTVMGTVAYMSPEQVRGTDVDHRSDIFSFGVILFELLSGNRPFTGDSAVELMNAILKDEPPEIGDGNLRIPDSLDQIVRRCMEKKPDRRFQSTSDLAFALNTLEPAASRLQPAPPGSTSQVKAGYFGNARLAWLTAGGLAVALLLLAIAHFRDTPAEVRPIRSSILAPDKLSFDFNRNGATVAVSPDGRHLAFVAAAADGKQILWVRSLHSLASLPLAGTEEASYPFWSPDSRSIGFFADQKLKKIDAAGGPALILCDAPFGRGGTWNRDGLIVFAPNNTGELHRVNASGGQTSAVTKLDQSRGEVTQRWPFFLPDGEHFIFLSDTASIAGTGTASIFVASIASGQSKQLLASNSNVAYASGYLLFGRDGTLFAQPFDAKRLSLTGEAVPIAEQVQRNPLTSSLIFSVSEQGVLAYLAGAGVGGTQLSWFDRAGKLLGALGDLARYNGSRLTPDGKRVAVSIFGPNSEDLWLFDVATGRRTRFTFDPGQSRWPVWSPDGSRIVFAANRKGNFELYQKASSGAGSDELLLESTLPKFPISFSPDGRLLLYYAFDPRTKADLWVLPLEGDRKPYPFLQTNFDERYGQFSPDGHWVVYQSTESGREEIFALPFPGPGGKRQISTAGGAFPRWRGQEIFFQAPDNKLTAVEVKAGDATLEVGAARPLFECRSNGWGYFYDVAPDGQRFLVNTALDQKVPITLVQNWTSGLKK